MNDTMKRFFHQLGFWTIHGTLLALPSFLIAGVWLDLFNSPAGIAAMLAGALPFLFGFTALTTFAKPFRDPQHLLPRALRLALFLRIGCVLLFASLSLKAPIFLSAIPDLWAGVGAAITIGWINEQFGYGTLLDFVSIPPLLVFFCTVLEGILLSFFISLLTFFCLLFLNRKDAKKWQTNIPHERAVEKLLVAPPHVLNPDSATRATSAETATQE